MSFPRRLLLIAGFLSAAVPAAEPRTGYFETSFDVIPSYARADVIAQRTAPPEKLREISGTDLVAYTVDPREEKWQVYVPAACVDGGCGVLVWMHADDAPRMDTNWQEVLDDERVVYVAALRAGDDHDAFERRLPLALTGLGAIATAYSIDPARVYLGGFAGGAKVAEVLAFGYPDVFHGVILNAGFLDPAGDLIAPPPAPLDEYLRNVPFAFVVGRRDELAWQDFNDARGGFADREIDVLEITDPRQGHRPMTGSQLRKALAHFESR